MDRAMVENANQSHEDGVLVEAETFWQPFD